MRSSSYSSYFSRPTIRKGSANDQCIHAQSRDSLASFAILVGSKRRRSVFVEHNVELQVARSFPSAGRKRFVWWPRFTAKCLTTQRFPTQLVSKDRQQLWNSFCRRPEGKRSVPWDACKIGTPCRMGSVLSKTLVQGCECRTIVFARRSSWNSQRCPCGAPNLKRLSDREHVTRPSACDRQVRECAGIA